VGDLVARLLDVPAGVVLLVVVALVFVEDAIFVGFVLPGETAAIVGGVAAHFGTVPLWAVLLVVVAAAIAGDSVGYEVGKKLGPRALDHRLLANHRDRLEDARLSLARRGGTAVFLGRWVAFFRAVMPALAGMARMPYRRFLVFNAAGGLVWGVVVVLAGYLAGASYERMAHVIGRGSAIVVVVLIVVVLVVRHVVNRRREADDADDSGGSAEEAA
jgi:membrane protein DedA with SNARE-associated domain